MDKQFVICSYHKGKLKNVKAKIRYESKRISINRNDQTFNEARTFIDLLQQKKQWENTQFVIVQKTEGISDKVIHVTKPILV